MTRSKRLWLIFFLLMMSSIAIALYYASPYIAQYSLQRWLAEQNFSEVELDMAPPQWGQLNINDLNLAKVQADRTLHITTGPIVIKFDPIDLLLQQRLQLVELPRSQITLSYPTISQNTAQKNTIKNDSANDSANLAQPLDLRHFLPKNLFTLLPVDHLRIGQMALQLNYPAPEKSWSINGALQLDSTLLYARLKFKREQTDLGWADIEIKPDNSFHLRLLDNNSPFFVTTGTLGFDKSLNLSSTQVMTLQNMQQWIMKFAPEFMSDIPSNLSHLSGSITSSGITQFPIKTRLSPDALLASTETKQVIQSQFTLTDFKNDSVNLDAKLIAGKIEGVIEYRDQRLLTELSPNSHLQAEKIQHNLLSKPLNQVSVRLPKGLKSHIDLSRFPSLLANGLTIEPTALTLTPSTLKLPDLNLELSPIKLKLTDIEPAKPALDLQLSIDAIHGQYDTKALPGFALNANIGFANNRVKSSFQLQGTDNPLLIKGNSKGSLNGQQQAVQWQLKPVSLSTLLPLARTWAEVPAELSVHGGTLFHNGHLQLKNQRLSITSKQSIEQAALQWDEIQLEQLEWHSQATLSPSGIFRDKGNVKLAKVKTGVEITNTQASYTFEHNNGRNLMEITEGVAQLLEGDVRLASTRFDPLAPEIETQISLNELDLGAILSLEQQEGLSGTGKLSGNFPLTFKNNALTIADGALAGLAPGGQISFLATPAVLAYAAGNAGLKIALEALENFHFETLDIKLNYSKDGTAHLNTRLKGNNPNWNEGHPIDFTINIEENIPKLLQTLQFTDKLTKSIEKRYR